MPDQASLSTDYPFEANWLRVRGSRMHFLDEGRGDPFVLLHGNPTWSYLWRNVVPHLSGLGRCVAPDLIGMGRSDKPDIGYTFAEHALYLDELLDRLELDRVTLVLHDWGSALGFHWARRHPERIKGLVFMEAIVRPARLRDLPFPLRLVFRRLRHPAKGRRMVMARNAFVEELLPAGTARPFLDAEMAHYREPYLDPEHREAMRVWPTQIPFDGEPPEVHDAVTAYYEWLQTGELPKLLFYVEPAFIIPPAVAEDLSGRLPNLETVFLGKGRHFTPEEYPHEIGRGTADWYRRLGLEGG